MEVNTICILGAGTMGTGIAQVAAQAGICVHLIDPFDDAIARSRKLLEKNLQESIKREKLTEGEAQKVKGLITWGKSYTRLRDADWVIEAVFENLEVKQDVLGQAALWAPKNVPIATNTSTFLVRDLAEDSGRPEYFIGMHFFNPPPAMKLVEVIPGEKTLPEVAEAAVALCRRLGKTPLTVPDIPGFVVNRAFGALVAAAIDVWAQGGEPETIDSAVEMGLGHKMGPLKTADLVGLDVMLALLRSLHRQTGDARFEVPQQFVEMVENGKLGLKSGEGFYNYK